MSTGTKAFLAFFALIVGMLVIYYGVIAPGNAANPASLAARSAAENKQAPSPQVPDVLARPATEMPAETPASFAAPSPVEAAPATSSDTAFVGPQFPADPLATSADSTAPRTELRPLVGLNNPEDPTVKANQPMSLELQPTQPRIEAPSPVTVIPRPDVKPPVVKSNPPQVPAVQPKRAAPPQTQEYAIKTGDTFMSIATEWFGDQTKWSLIAKANPLVDPNRLQIGQKIKLPSKDATPEPIKSQVAATADSSQYIVRSGDTLAKIAREFYGDVGKWQAIYNANKALIGSDPANLKTGTKLTLPPNLKKSN